VRSPLQAVLVPTAAGIRSPRIVKTTVAANALSVTRVVREENMTTLLSALLALFYRVETQSSAAAPVLASAWRPIFHWPDFVLIFERGGCVVVVVVVVVVDRAVVLVDITVTVLAIVEVCVSVLDVTCVVGVGVGKGVGIDVVVVTLVTVVIVIVVIVIVVDCPSVVDSDVEVVMVVTVVIVVVGGNVVACSGRRL